MHSQGLVMVNFIHLKTKQIITKGKTKDFMKCVTIEWISHAITSTEVKSLFKKLQFKLNSEMKLLTVSFEIIVEYVIY